MSRFGQAGLRSLLAALLLALIVLSCGGEDPGPGPSPEPGAVAVPPEGTHEPDSPPVARDERATGRISRVGGDAELSVRGGMRPASVYSFDSPASTTPVLWGDLLIVGTAGGSLLAVDVESGAPRWRTDLGSPVSALAVDEAAVYAAASARMWAADPRSGAITWTTETASPVVTGLTSDDGHLYVGLAGLETVAVSAADGAIVWSAPVDGRPVDRIVARSGSVYCATEGGTIVSLDARTGARLRVERLEQVHVAAPTVGAERVISVGVDGEVVIRGDDGSDERWTVDAAPVLVAPVSYRDILVIADGAGRIHAHTLAGEALWTFDLPMHLAGVPVRLGDVLILGDAGGGVFAIDLSNASTISRFSLRSPVEGEAALWNDTLFWALRDGTVRSVRVDDPPVEIPRLTGDRTWVIPEGGTFDLADDEVTLSMRPQRDATFGIAITATPPQELSIRVESGDGDAIAASSPQTWGPRVTVVLDAGVSYQLVISRAPGGTESTVTLEIEQLR